MLVAGSGPAGDPQGPFEGAWRAQDAGESEASGRVGSNSSTGLPEGSSSYARVTCRPHSVFSAPAQRPSRPAPGSVHGAQPIDS